MRSVVERKNVIWETTGANLSWIVYALMFMKGNNYKIVLAVPITGLNQLLERCKKRKQAANCSIEYLSAVRKQSFENFPIISKLCDRTLIFDNTKKMFLIYDSQTKFCDNRNSLKRDPNQSPLHEYFEEKCGKSRKRRSSVE